MIRALLVDDHPAIRHAVRRLLEGSGDVEVVAEAVDGEQALEEIERLEPDVVLLDIYMPRMNGFAVLQALREKLPRPKIVVLSMNGSDSTRQKALAAGAHAFVPKRAAYNELLPAIRVAVD